MSPNSTPAWDQEATYDQARHQVHNRVEEQRTTRGSTAHWLGDADPTAELAAVEALAAGSVVAAEMVLHRWPPAALSRLSSLLRDRGGLLVFVEPTAGLGLRRLAQLAGRRYRSDVPAELRSAGFSVTTQIRFRHGLVGDYVRGEAQHFPTPTEVSAPDQTE